MKSVFRFAGEPQDDEVLETILNEAENNPLTPALSRGRSEKKPSEDPDDQRGEGDEAD